ncbi:uncharacterized protein LOC135394449 [Ornithodoros turicata]|uniref:uncharacterized protein LOC135394449 n=1 Tax=Ornithodoros turicata TaxID=34597 RepID=UPI00313904F7
MKFMKTCCCGCCTVETGTKILGILGAISFTSQLFGTISGAMDSDYRAVAQYIQIEKVPFKLHDFVVTHAVFSAIGLLVCILCTVGAFQRRRNFLIPYLVVEAIILVELGIIIILLAVLCGVVGAIDTSQSLDPENAEGARMGQTVVVAFVASLAVSLLITLFMAIYYFIVVLSFYKELEASERNPQPSVAYCSVPGNVPPGYPPQGYPQSGGGPPPGYGPQGGFYPPLPEHKGDVV